YAGGRGPHHRLRSAAPLGQARRRGQRGRIPGVPAGRLHYRGSAGGRRRGLARARPVQLHRAKLSRIAYNSVFKAEYRMIDEIDATILELLQDNARTSQADIARAVGLAPSAVLERIRKLEGKAVIRGYAALVDPHVLDQRMLAF